MKLVAILFIFSGIVAANTQLSLGLDLGLGIGRTGPPPPEFFQNVVLNSEAQKVLTTPDLPADLQQRVLDTTSSAELGFKSCSTVSTLPWFQMRCVALQLSKSKAELKAIEDEAKARSATTEESVQTPPEAASA